MACVFSSNVATLARFFSRFVVYVLGNAILVMGILGLLFSVDWRIGLGLSAFVVLALLAMLIVVASGLTGKYLLQEARESLRERATGLREAGLQPAEVERELLTHSLLVDTMKNWRRVHMPLTMVFAGLAAIHIVATLLLWRW